MDFLKRLFAFFRGNRPAAAPAPAPVRVAVPLPAPPVFTVRAQLPDTAPPTMPGPPRPPVLASPPAAQQPFLGYPVQTPFGNPDRETSRDLPPGVRRVTGAGVYPGSQVPFVGGPSVWTDDTYDSFATFDDNGLVVRPGIYQTPMGFVYLQAGDGAPGSQAWAAQWG